MYFNSLQSKPIAELYRSIVQIFIFFFEGKRTHVDAYDAYCVLLCIILLLKLLVFLSFWDNGSGFQKEK